MFRCCDFLSAMYAAIATATVAGAVGLGFSPAEMRSYRGSTPRAYRTALSRDRAFVLSRRCLPSKVKWTQRGHLQRFKLGSVCGQLREWRV